MIYFGYQSVLLNQFDKDTQYYKQWNIEKDCRDMAKRYKNSYIMAVFACCRELFQPTSHNGGFGGSF